jgi:hypothetical protein
VTKTSTGPSKMSEYFRTKPGKRFAAKEPNGPMRTFQTMSVSVSLVHAISENGQEYLTFNRWTRRCMDCFTYDLRIVEDGPES